MSKHIATGVIGVTPEGKYLVEGYAAGYISTKKHYGLTDNINNATLFESLPRQDNYVVTAVPAWSERIIRIGNPDTQS